MSISEKYKVKPIDTFQCKEWLLKKHYAKRIPSITYSFGLFDDITIVGVCTFGIPPQQNCMLLCGEEYKENASNQGDPIRFYKSKNNLYFFQTAGFEFIWKV
jgi:hypothetical protein